MKILRALKEECYKLLEDYMLNEINTYLGSLRYDGTFGKPDLNKNQKIILKWLYSVDHSFKVKVENGTGYRLTKRYNDDD